MNNIIENLELEVTSNYLRNYSNNNNQTIKVKINFKDRVITESEATVYME